MRGEKKIQKMPRIPQLHEYANEELNDALALLQLKVSSCPFESRSMGQRKYVSDRSKRFFWLSVFPLSRELTLATPLQFSKALPSNIIREKDVYGRPVLSALYQEATFAQESHRWATGRLQSHRQAKKDHLYRVITRQRACCICLLLQTLANTSSRPTT